MKYYTATFSIKCADNLSQTCRDLVALLAGEAGFESFEETADGGLKGYVQKANYNPEALSKAISDFPISGVEITYTLQEAEDEDWNKAWEDSGFRPINISSRLLVFDAKRPVSGSEVPEGALAIGIEARLAFGTGTHETTRMMLAMLLETDLKGRRVLDCGCGTGILSIAASKLGARECVGYDIDEWSVSNTRHNAELNGATNITVMYGDASVLRQLEGTFDVVMANINRNILLADMPSFAAVMAPHSTLLISGFYEADIPLLLSKAASLGLKEASRHAEGDWAALRLVRS